MKQLCLLIIILLAAPRADGQKIRFTTTNNNWLVNQYTINPIISTMGWGYVDTVFVDTLKYYKLNHVLVREDTVSNRIYTREQVSTPYVDTFEQVLYDFNLKVGDTIELWKQKSDTNRHFVAKVDSVVINGVYHKLWQYDPLPNNPVGQYSYIVIEGIGSMGGPLYPLNPVGFEQHYRLVCFTKNGSLVTVPDNDSIPCPYGGNYLSLSTCLLDVEDNVAAKKSVVISPHPANASSVITLPYTLQKGELIIYNTLGQIIRQVLINKTSKVILGQLPGAGMYYYRVNDKLNGKGWQEKVVYE